MRIGNKTKTSGRVFRFTLLTSSLILMGMTQSYAVPLNGVPATYTLTEHFEEGSGINVTYDNDQVELDNTTSAFNFIWVAASSRGTIVKIDTSTGVILGEYQSAPDTRWRNPSRTTVDANGNVWAGNRDESDDTGEGNKGSVVHIGLQENGQCVDRNDNGIIDTSSGLGDILPWSNSGNADTNGGISTATDECIIHYVRTDGTNVRTMALDSNNNLWTGGYGNQVHQLIDGVTGNPVPGSQFNLGCGGYGGLMDANGVLWSASLSNALLRYDTNTATGSCLPLDRTSYGLGIDTNGNIWHTNFGFDTVMKIASDGSLSGTFSTFGASGDRGVAITPADNNVWVANSGGNDISRLDNNGAFLTTITVGNNPTGVAVDGKGKVWVTNLGSDSAMRIDPLTNTVDLTVNLGAGAGPYNYSDMTGSTVIAPPNSGTWSVIHDSLTPSEEWGFVSWNADIPGDSVLSVAAASSEDGVTFGASEIVSNGVDLSIADGRYIKVDVSFTRSTNIDANGDGIFDGPILYDLTIDTNKPPVCDVAEPSITMIWPPNHKFIPVNVLGVYDPDGDAFSISIDSIYQDEPVNDVGDGNTSPDGLGVGTDTAEVRAERSGNKKLPGNGRVYHIEFSAEDEFGDSCSGEVSVAVPHDQGKGSTPIDDGALYDSTMP